ncbi:uncharacterized protein MONOS_947 [Monocercomonoides exilis]|uniref:uncharacterized protein n=1 Tax=Monocercomonoides exilis TaxID=2049356 RepID=UPI00355A4DB2|nr:hypothetical protein MONOS_947 [Monocercomonoides exilis]|eukprot:MONOS_947.1-p1 / transcript=MONOS_947.1 / gene=MONOS_947 / organism=Monocercomonoides_exilis_PA203 / gene_product=unspecified product / transcript_product=unspecified product / location=Mono_scaffold00015:236529-237593(-) / protein_length=273 / sequence_SO=supercontig / SO=protein_coding / is_pseudo=false
MLSLPSFASSSSSSSSISSLSAPGYSLVKKLKVSSTALIESYLDAARVLVSFSSNGSSSHSVSSSSSSLSSSSSSSSLFSSFGHSSQQSKSVSTETLPSSFESDEETIQQLAPSTPHEPLLVSLLSSFLDISSASIVLGRPCLHWGMQKLHVAVLFSSLFELLNSALNNSEINTKWPGMIPARVAKSLGAVIKYQADVIMDVPRCLSVGGDDDDDDDKNINVLSGASPSSSSSPFSSSSLSSLNNLTKKRQMSLLPVSVALTVILNELSQLH